MLEDIASAWASSQDPEILISSNGAPHYISSEEGICSLHGTITMKMKKKKNSIIYQMKRIAGN